MRSRLFPIVIVLLIFVVGLSVGRYLILPALRGGVNTTAVQRIGIPADARYATATPISPRLSGIDPNQSAFNECMQEARQRRVDPIEARHVCNVIADNL